MLGTEIQRLRIRAGLTQEELALKAGIHRTYVSILERDQQSPTVDVLFRICAALGVRPSEVLARFEAKYSPKGRLPRRT